MAKRGRQDLGRAIHLERLADDAHIRGIDRRGRIADAAFDVLKETGNKAVMWGDVGLLHKIAARAGIRSQGPKTERHILNSLSKQPGKLIPGYTTVLTACGFIGRAKRIVRTFRMPEVSNG